MVTRSGPESDPPGAARPDGDPGDTHPMLSRVRRYWRANLTMLGILLAHWFTASLALGVIFVEPLNEFRLGGFPLGFWFAHQGAIYVFIVLILVYATYMDRLEKRLRRR